MSIQLKYRIENLEWQQFELLAFKCLQCDISPSIQYLERGNDKGRDFIFEGVTKYFGHSNSVQSIIFQAKHKSKSTDFSVLKRDLARELKKVYIQNCFTYQHYCLVTNLALTGNEYDELTQEFSEFKKRNSLSIPKKFEIYSYRHFETCLDKNKQLRIGFPSIIQVADFKFLLEEIVLKTEQNIISSWLRVFEKSAAKFIYTKIYEDSLSSISTTKAILLSGPPKSGKTFTAEMLALTLFIESEYLPYKINNIDAFHDFFDFNKKQLFLFDDSIGKHNIESYRADALDRSVISILHSLDDNHKIIFTSREYIIKDYQAYSDSDFFLNSVVKINASTAEWSAAEKESLLHRYYKLTFNNELSDNITQQIIRHKKFEPESIRAFFENNPIEFNYSELIKHLNKPDQYLHTFFNNIDEDKRIVILSILLSLNGTEIDIGFTCSNILDDLKIQRLINLTLQLEILQDSVTVKNGDVHSFLHPSMFDFFTQLISTDVATYRKLIFKNINLNILATISLKAKSEKNRLIFLEESDLGNLSIGLERIVRNPSITLFDINSIFAWFTNPDFQLRKRTHGYSELKRPFIKSLQSLNYSHIIKNSSIFHAIDFIKNVNMEGERSSLNSIAIETILKRFKQDANYWRLVLHTSSFLNESQISQLFGKQWFNNFYKNLKDSIDMLGVQLFGNAYPEFHELRQHKEAAINKSVEGKYLSLEKQQKSFYMQKTNVDWYPNYIGVKQQVSVLKSCHPHGYKIYAKVIERFEMIKRLEDHEKNRYNYKLKNKAWDMINGFQPKFMNNDDYERLEDEYYSDYENQKEEEE